jgi:hypothetical protein
LSNRHDRGPKDLRWAPLAAPLCPRRWDAPATYVSISICFLSAVMAMETNLPATLAVADPWR